MIDILKFITFIPFVKTKKIGENFKYLYSSDCVKLCILVE